jgi:hypothetical protein
MTTARVSVLAGLATAALLAGCATTDSFSQLDGQRWRKAELNTFDVTIISVDGKHYIQRAGEPLQVVPGAYKIVVQGPPVAGFRFGEQRTLELNVEPCVRYWLEAKKDNSLAQDFVPRVNYSEPIAGCAVKK